MKSFLGLLISFTIGLLTLSGHIQQVIYFADPLNELAFASVAFTTSILCIITLCIPNEQTKHRRLIRRGKIARITAILLDKSEAFEDNPAYRYEIVQKIWTEKN